MLNALLHKQKNIFYVGGLIFLTACAIGFSFNQFIVCAIPLAVLALIFFLHDIRIPFFLLMFSIPLSINLIEIMKIGVDFPDEPLMLFLTSLFLFFLFLNWHKLQYKEILKNPVVILILLSLLWMMISVYFSKHPAFSAKYLVKRIWYIIPFLFLPMFFFQSKNNIVRAFNYMFVPLLILVMIVLVRYNSLNFEFDEVHKPIQPFFVNHVIYGSMISCFLPLIVGAFLIAKKYSFQWLLYLTAILIFLIGIYFSYSRAAWIAVIFALFAAICIQRKILHYMFMIFYSVLFAVVLWLSINNQYLKFRPNANRTIMHESLADHVMATLQGTDISSAERYYRWIAAIRMSVDNPITGVGPNNFYEYYKTYTIVSYQTWVSRNLEHSTSHNYFLFMLAEQGYPALILYAALIFMIFFYGQKVYHTQKDKFSKISVMSALAMIAALFVNNFFSELLETDKIGSLFLLGIAVVIAIDLKSRKLNDVEIEK